MVLYFSGTGNSKYLAECIAKRTEDTAISIVEINNEIVLNKGEQLGIVFPIYFWGLPSILEEFFKRIKILGAEDSYIFCAATYGSTCGQADNYLNKLLKKKGLNLSSSFGVKTVDNYTVWFDVKDKDILAQILKEEESQIKKVTNQVLNREKVFINKDKKSKFLCVGARICYENARKTKHLKVNNQCIGCGLCAKDCPVGAIKIKDMKPIWIKKKCTMCFKCLHNCPKFAINYDNKTQKNGQYTRPQKFDLD